MGKRKVQRPLTAVVANMAGEIFDLDGYAAVGMAGEALTVLTNHKTIDMPYGSELMLLKDRSPVLFNLDTAQFEVLERNPYAPDEPLYPVAAFNSPGYVNAYMAAYVETASAENLPLFSYGAAGWYGNGFRSAVIQVDKERRQDLRLMPPEKVRAGIDKMRKIMPRNRLRAHLEKCALVYGCPAAKNFFIGRFEAPLPTSKACNAKCLGCISLQEADTRIKNPQDRIGFTPKPDEIAEVALTHIKKVNNSVVSFGQGCEGDPLLAAHVIGPAVEIIRRDTDQGTININTNGSKPDTLRKLFNSGMDSVRISMNSTRKSAYNAYFRPGGYTFEDVAASIDVALSMEKIVSLNYLNCPGVTDTPEEVESLLLFLEKHPVHMIQWRNLNFDPLRYCQDMNKAAPMGESIGMKSLLRLVRKEFPELKYGYFNPPKETFLSMNVGFDYEGNAFEHS